VKGLIAFVCLSLISILVHAEGASFGFSLGLVQGEAGRTSISIEYGGGGFAGTISRGVSAQIDLAATAGEDRFDLEGRLLAIDLPPLGILLTASFRGFGVLTRLSLGPVRLDIARGWGKGGRRRVTVSVFPVKRIFLLAGWEGGDGGSSAFLGLRLNPGRDALWGLFLIIGKGYLTLGLGGAF